MPISEDHHDQSLEAECGLVPAEWRWVVLEQGPAPSLPVAATSVGAGDLSNAPPCPRATRDAVLDDRYCSDGRSGTVMVTGLPVRGSNRVMVIRTSHNSNPSRRAVCHVGGTLPCALKSSSALDRLLVLRWVGTASDPVGPLWRSSGGARHSARDDRLGPPMPQAVEVVK